MSLRILRKLGVCLAFGLLSHETTAMPAEPPESVRQGNAFACDVYRRLAPGGGNLVLSPRSLESAVAILLAGAAGKTEVELAQGLGVPGGIRDGLKGDDPHAIEYAKARWGALRRSGKGYEVTSATKLWSARPLLKEFDSRTATLFGVEAERVDLAQPAAVQRRINGWVSRETRGKIPTLLAGPPPPSTSLLITNAVYFQAAWGWEPGFSSSPGTFFAGGEAVGTKMMKATVRTGHGESDGADLVELPYAGGEFSALVLLPRWKKEEGARELAARLSALERKLTADRLEVWRKRLEPKLVTMTLPELRMSNVLSLLKHLAEMEMGTAFGPEADYSRMGDGKLFVTDVEQSALIEVNERGTTAAAATRVPVGAGSAAKVDVVADHPFLFLIRDQQGAILFLARVADPRSDAPAP